MTMITPSYLGETIEYSSLHACRSTLEDPTWMYRKLLEAQELGPRVSGGQAAGLLRMRAATAEMAVRQAQKIPRRQLVEGLRALYDADSRLKSGSADDRAVMEFLVARLIGGGPAGKAR